MCLDRLSFLSEFDNFYQALVRDLKENKYNEANFYEGEDRLKILKNGE